MLTQTGRVVLEISAFIVPRYPRPNYAATVHACASLAVVEFPLRFQNGSGTMVLYTLHCL
jgi:hypothetical protein